MAARDNIREQFVSNIPIKEFNKGISLLDKREYSKAITVFNKVKKVIEFKEVWLNLGVAYKGLNNHPKVRECFERAIDPNIPFSNATFDDTWPLAVSNLGLAYFAEEKDSLAEICFRNALTKDPLYYDAIWNLALVKLRQYCSDKYTDLSQAWTYYTYRFKRSKAEPLKSDNPSLIMWDFKTSYSTPVIVLVEQGMGDSIMFGRYLSELGKYFPKIYVQCTPELNVFFDNPVSRTSECSATHCVPMCSLGKLLDHIPSGQWLEHLYKPKERGSKLEILCIWGGSVEHVNAHNRNVPAGWFDKLSAYGNLHSVEKRRGYAHMPITDWAATIAYLEGIDIVVTIDSSVAHLCGSLGKPCLVLMPLYDSDFRWGDSSMGFNNKWYSSVKVIRNPGSWEKVFQTVDLCLAAV